MKKFKTLVALGLLASTLASCSNSTNEFKKLAIGGDNVPVGEYSVKILNYFGLDVDELKSKNLLTLGTDVKEVTNQVKQGLVSAGIVYQTDAFSAGLM